MDSSDDCLIHAFTDDAGGSGVVLRGNPCRLQIETGMPAGPPVLPHTTTLCQTWPLDPDTSLAAVRCFSVAGTSIQLCGHGLLSAADFWLGHWAVSSLTLEMHGNHVAAWREQACTWLRFARLATEPCEVPVWLAALSTRLRPIAAAKAGDEQGYRVLEFAAGTDLQQLPAPGPALAEHTQRALIYTAAQPEQERYDISLRYFAPQHGVDEDNATGSAMRVLADYWSPRFVALRAVQCSAAGGFLMSRMGDGCVEVGGYCSRAQEGTALG